jgi:CHASE3 domain sensor protein
MNPNREFLERRNQLWKQLRELEPDDPSSEALLTELEALIGWPRTRILQGLGWETIE